MTFDLQALVKRNNGEVPFYAWPGGYPLIYWTADGGVLCPQCVQESLDNPHGYDLSPVLDPDDPQWFVIGYDTYDEGPNIQCDNCYREIESSYGDPDEELDGTEGQDRENYTDDQDRENYTIEED